MKNFHGVILALALLSLPSCGGKKEMVKEGAMGAMRVTITQEGFQPSEVIVGADEPVTLEFIRTTDQTCITGVHFPKTGVTVNLPLNETVEIPIQAKAGEEIEFTCPMNMYFGKVVTK